MDDDRNRVAKVTSMNMPLPPTSQEHRCALASDLYRHHCYRIPLSAKTALSSAVIGPAGSVAGRSLTGMDFIGVIFFQRDDVTTGEPARQRLDRDCTVPGRR
jgi:hypothetical protein